MSQSKTRVLFLLGGRSGEHEISLISGKHILTALDRTRFEPLLVIIQKDGTMTLGNETEILKLSDNPKKLTTPKGATILLRPFSPTAIIAEGKAYEFDVAFPVLHGPGGEDGTIQGFFEFSKIPVVGCDVKASAICMDKGMTKRLAKEVGIPVAPFREIYPEQKESFVKSNTDPFPLFVKPAHLGSSLGVAKVKNLKELEKALAEVFSMDTKALVEKAIVGREIEVAVLGRRGKLTISPAGEVRCLKSEFYSYDAKYIDGDAVELLLPTTLSALELTAVQTLSARVFETLECRGMARIDYFLTQDGEFLLNEVNTIPGFTPISMYPKLIQLMGISYKDLISELIDLAG